MPQHANLVDINYDKATADSILRQLEGTGFPDIHERVEALHRHTGVIATGSEAELTPWNFGVFKVSSDIVTRPSELQAFAATTARLSMLGLGATVIVDAKKPVIAGLDMHRWQDPDMPDVKVHDVMRNTAESISAKLAKVIRSRGGQVTELDQIFIADISGVGDKVIDIKAEPIVEAMRPGDIMLIGCVGETTTSNGVVEPIYVDPTEAWNVATRQFKPLKKIAVYADGLVPRRSPLAAAVHSARSLAGVGQSSARVDTASFQQQLYAG